MKINRKNIIAILKSFESPLWCEREVDGLGEVHNWLPIFVYCSASTKLQHRYGLLANGVWVCEFSDNLRVRPEAFYPGFLVLLESPFNEVVSLLRSSISQIGLPEIVITSFPLDAIIETALTGESYWSDLAEGWINQGYPLNENIPKLIPNNKMVIQWRKERIEKIFDM